MKLTLVFVVGSLSFGAPQHRPVDRWFARDKAKHFVVSAVVQGVGHSVLRANGHEYRDAAWTAAALTMGVGVGKEVWDLRRGRMFSWKDLAADAAGGGTGAILIRQMDR